MSVFEFAGLKALQRLSLVRVHKVTDIGIFSLAEHATALERLHLSYCDGLSLEAIHLLLRKLESLQHLTATGVPSFRRKGIHRFSDAPPTVCTLFMCGIFAHLPSLWQTYDPNQQAAFRVFSGENVAALRRFLDKEDKRRQDAEARNIPFAPRSDDKLDLY